MRELTGTIADFQTAVETYTRDGKAYEIRYTVTRDDL